MRNAVIVLLCCFATTQIFGQKQRTVSTYLLANYNHTLYDYTIGNNPWGMGLGLQTFFNTKSKFKPLIELTGNLYLEDDRVLKLNPDGSIPQNDNTVRSIVKFFGVFSFHPTQSIYVSLLAGPSFINGRTLLGVKPAFGFNFSKTQRWIGNISYINVFNRDNTTKESFGTISFTIGLKLF